MPRLLVYRSLFRMFFPKRFDLNVDTGGQIELGQSGDRVGCRLQDVDQTFVRSDFELLPRLFVGMRRAQHAVLILDRGQGNGASNLRTITSGSGNDLRRRLVKHSVIVGLKPYSDLFV